jgi:2-dehydro-3-deoxygluconokinase
MTRVVIIGEAMLELSHPAGGEARLAYGGDTLNTAIYLARLGHTPHYITALGHDPYSQTMLREWERECVQIGQVLRHPTRLPGLYAVQTDHAGERQFYYWRENSAARALFELEGAIHALAFAAGADWLYLSGITLSIFQPSERETLIHLAKRVRDNGGQVVFDPNYRPRGWSSPEEAAEVMSAIAPYVSIALPTIEDENALHGQAKGDVHAQRWQGAELVLLKCGPQGAIVYRPNQEPVRVPVRTAVKPVDTTGAGDSFNAAFLASLLRGADPERAAASGNLLAGAVIQHAGAIIPRAAMPETVLA